MSPRSTAQRRSSQRGAALASILCVTAVSIACGSPDAGEPACLAAAPSLDCKAAYGLVNGQIQPTFDELWSRTLQQKCGVGGCHAAPDPKNGLALDVEDTAYNDLSGKSSTGEPRVTPGNISCGKFMVRLETPGEPWSMPPGSHLDESELCVIRHWVANLSQAMNVHRFVLSSALVLSSLPAACKSDDGDEATYPIDKLKDPATCKECHADHYREWSGSMHAYASKDPVFLAMNARGQRETHGELGQFCVNCHAPMAVQDGLLNDGGTNVGDLANEDQGITCYFCHNVSDVHGTSNNPLVLAKDNVMRGRYGDPLQNKAHKSAQSAFHDSREAPSAKLCGSCHDIVVPAHFAGAESDQHLERTFEEWTESIFSDPKSGFTNNCGASGCHMRTDKKKPIADYPGVPTRDVRHHHDFPGVDVALTDFPEKAAQLAAVDDFLSTSLLVSLCVSDRGFADVTVENLTGHNFPSGASQDRRAWVELHAYSDDAKTKEYFSRGAVPAGGAVTDLLATEPDLWLMRDLTTKKNGEQAHMFWDVANIERNTILTKIANLPTMAGYHQEAPARSFDMALNGEAPKAVTLTVHVQPIGTDVLRDLVATGDLPAASGSAGDAGAMPALTMPTHDLIPNKDAGATATIEWTKQKSLDSNNYKQAPGGGLLYCVGTSTILPQQ